MNIKAIISILCGFVIGLSASVYANSDSDMNTHEMNAAQSNSQMSDKAKDKSSKKGHDNCTKSDRKNTSKNYKTEQNDS